MRNFLLMVILFFGVLVVEAQSLDYAAPGEYHAAAMELTIEDDERPLNVTVWYPTNENDGKTAVYRSGFLSFPGSAFRDAEPAVGNFPLVIFSHGSNGFRVQSLFFTEHLATHGFIVITADHPGNTASDSLNPGQTGLNLAHNYRLRLHDIQRLVEFAGTLNGEGGALEGLINLDKIGISGHSFGGYTSFASSGGQVSIDSYKAWCNAPVGVALPDFTLIDPYPDASEFSCFLNDLFDRVELAGDLPLVDIQPDAIVAFAPWNAPIFSDLSTVTAPTMIIVGSADSITVPERDAYRFYTDIGSETKSLAVLEGADHFLFMDECSATFRNLGLSAVCTDPAWDMAAGHDVINHLATAFLLWTLKDDSEAAAALENVDLENVRYFR